MKIYEISRNGFPTLLTHPSRSVRYLYSPFQPPTKKKRKKARNLGGAIVLHAACVVSQGMSGSVLMGEVRNAPEEACGVDPGIRRIPVSHWTGITATSLTPLARLLRRMLLRDMISTQELIHTETVSSARTLNRTENNGQAVDKAPCPNPRFIKRKEKTRITPLSLTYRYPYIEQPEICQTCACAGG